MKVLTDAQLDILRTIADLNGDDSAPLIEDVQVAEAVELPVNAVQLSLEFLAEEGYVFLERIERLSGKGYNIALTEEGREAIDKNEYFAAK